MSNQYVIKQTYLRMPEELHKRLRHEAAEDDVSLNKCILNLLAEALKNLLFHFIRLWTKNTDTAVMTGLFTAGIVIHTVRESEAKIYSFHALTQETKSLLAR